MKCEDRFSVACKWLLPVFLPVGHVWSAVPRRWGQLRPVATSVQVMQGLVMRREC